MASNMNLFDAMDRYDRALNKIIEQKAAEAKAAGVKTPLLLSDIMKTITDVPLGNGFIARHYENGKMRFMHVDEEDKTKT